MGGMEILSLQDLKEIRVFSGFIWEQRWAQRKSSKAQGSPSSNSKSAPWYGIMIGGGAAVVDNCTLQGGAAAVDNCNL